METHYDAVWPRSPLAVQAHRLAPRLDALAAKRVGFLWDHLFRGDELFPVIAAELVSRFPDLEIVDYTEFGNTHGGDEADMITRLPDNLRSRGIDAVVSGMGC